MINTSQKRGFGQRINRWLDEPPGETFKAGKWRFWLPMLLGFSLLNAVMTAMVFGSGGQLQTYLGGILLGVGVLLAWLCIGTLHYSDSADVRMAKGVSLLDSITLVFVIAHFCFLLWVQGHVWALQAREADYKVATATYNEKAERIQADNVRIAEETRKTAQEVTKAERLRNDTAYQERRAAEAGVRRPRAGGSSPGQSSSPALSPIELEKPEKPKQSSTEFLTTWDLWIRLMNFGELALAAITFIFIRNRSARFNASVTRRDDEDFPSELDADVVENRTRPRLEKFTKKKDAAKTQTSFDFDRGEDGLKRLRSALRDISFRLAGVSFKTDVNPKFKECRTHGVTPDHVLIRAMRANQGTQETIHSAKAKLSILDDALTMEPTAFRERVERFLRQNGFKI